MHLSVQAQVWEARENWLSRLAAAAVEHRTCNVGPAPAQRDYAPQQRSWAVPRAILPFNLPGLPGALVPREPCSGRPG